MPPKKKKKLESVLAPDLGDGKPRKYIPVDTSTAARARRREQRMIQQADEAEAAAKQAASAQRERPILGRSVVGHGKSPEEDEEEGMQFNVTLDMEPKASNKVKPVVSSSRRGSEPVITQFEVTLSGSDVAAQKDLINESHVRFH